MRTLKLLILSTLLLIPCFSANPESFSVPTNREELQKQKLFFQERGYLLIRNFFSEDQVHLFNQLAEDINQEAQSLLLEEDDLQSFENIIVVPEADNPLIACRTEDNLSFFPKLKLFVKSQITPYIEDLFSERFAIFKDKLNFKSPGGGAFTPHQDFPAFEFFAPRSHVSAMICIDPATLENGCLQVAQNWRETFKDDPLVDRELLEEGQAILPYIIGGKNHGSIKPQSTEKITWIPLEITPLDLLLFDSFVPHYSETNRSRGSRRAFFLTYNRLIEGDVNKAYYHAKRSDPENPAFHFGTPTKARGK